LRSDGFNENAMVVGSMFYWWGFANISEESICIGKFWGIPCIFFSALRVNFIYRARALYLLQNKEEKSYVSSTTIMTCY